MTKQAHHFVACVCLILTAGAVGWAQKPELVVQTGHSSAVVSVAFSPDGKLLASGGNDKTIRLWEVTTGRELRTLTGYPGAVDSVAFSPDGQTLASGRGESIRLCDVATGRELRTLNGHAWPVDSVAFSPDGKTLASGSRDNTIKLWDVASGTELRTLKGHSLWVGSVAFSPDGQTLASGSWDRAIKLWETATGREMLTLTGHSQYVTSVAFSADGKTLASGSADDAVKLWEVATGKALNTLAGHSGSISSVAFSPDGKTLATSNSDGLKLWDIATVKELRTLSKYSSLPLAFSADGKMLASVGQDKTVKLWEVATGKALNTLAGYSSSIHSIAFSADGTLASGKDDGTIRLRGMATGREMRTLTGHSSRINSVAFSPDGRTLASVSGGHTVDSADEKIKLWEVTTGRELRTLTGHSEHVNSVVFSPDGQTLASGSDDGTIKLWSLATGRELRLLVDRSSVESVSFSPDGQTLASGHQNSTIKLWEVTTGRELRTLTGHRAEGVFSVTFSPDGKTLASGSHDETIKLWEVATGRELRTLKAHSAGVFSVAFTADGKTLASGSSDSTIKLWEVATGRELLDLTGHSDSVLSVAFSPDENFLISGSLDASLKLWRVDSGKLEATLTAFDEQDWIAITPDGLFDGSPAAWNKVIWRFNNNTFNYVPVEAFFNDFFYPGLLSEILTGKTPKAPSEISDKDRRPPQLKLTTDSEAGATLTTRNVTVRVEVSEAPAGAQDVRLFRNGSLVKVWHGDVLKGHSRVTLDAQIPIVAGENRLTTYAFNHDNIKSTEAFLVISGADTLRRPGTLYVLAIGINKYASAGHDLRFAVADVDEMGKELEAQQHKLGNFARTKLISLLDRLATKANLMLAMRRFVDGPQIPLPRDASPELRQQMEKIKKPDPEDALIIYFAGHGIAKDQHFYLLPYDFIAGSEERLKASSVSDMELHEILEGVGAGKLLMVIDACQSGQALGSEKAGSGPMNSKGLAQLAYDKGMYILTAAQSYQAAKEVSRSLAGQKIEHGLLTFALLEGMSKAIGNNEGKISEREWMNYAVEQVPLMQTQEMKKRNLRNRQGGGRRGRGIELVFALGDNENMDPEKRSVQRPRVFYRRELEDRPLIVAKR